MEKLSSHEIELIESLIERGYIIKLATKYSFTGKFTREFAREQNVETGLVVCASKALETRQDKVLKGKELLTQFRKDAEIPFRISNDGGKPFTCGAISTDGINAFIEILKSGVDYSILAHATKLYYKRDSYRKGLTNYLVQGDYEVEYEALKQSLEKDNVQEYIKKELDSGKSSNMQIR